MKSNVIYDGQDVLSRWLAFTELEKNSTCQGASKTMLRYKETDILRLAKRINNSKRSYLLVNPLQAKHIPVSPSNALRMMTSLGELVSERYGDARLVIGFAETATAIGAVVAKTISDECTFIHTTREKAVGANNYVFFTEEQQNKKSSQMT